MDDECLNLGLTILRLALPVRRLRSFKCRESCDLVLECAGFLKPHLHAEISAAELADHPTYPVFPTLYLVSRLGEVMFQHCHSLFTVHRSLFAIRLLHDSDSCRARNSAEKSGVL